MSITDKFLKRTFDILVSICGLILSSPVILICWTTAAIETRSNGFFIHERVGRNGRAIKVWKIKTMYVHTNFRSPISSKNQSVITKSGLFFRKWKLDELPQLFNVLVGSMSIVGPRPDVPGYADRLNGDDRIILLLRPGITGPASIKYKNEEDMLMIKDNAVLYNDTVIWPDKVLINKRYFINYSFLRDIRYILETFVR